METKTFTTSKGEVITYSTVLTRKQFREIYQEAFDKNQSEVDASKLNDLMDLQEKQIMALCTEVQTGDEVKPFTKEFMDTLELKDFNGLFTEIQDVVNGANKALSEKK